MTNTRRVKNSYSTSMIFKYQMGLLMPEEVHPIPRSTRYSWKNKDFSNLIGFNPDETFMANAQTLYSISEVPQLLKLNEAALMVIEFYKSIVNNLRGYKRIWRKNKELIVQTIANIKSTIGIDSAVDFLGITRQKFYRWRRNFSCESSTFGICRKLHPGQLTIHEQDTIKTYVTNPENLAKHSSQIYYEMMHNGSTRMSLNTFYLYAKLFRKNSTIPRKEKRHTGIRSDAPFKILHMDTTLLRTLDGAKVFIHLIIDNFSRVILGWKASLSPGSINPAQNLLDVCERHNLFHKEIDLLCDDGSENKGEVSLLLERKDVLLNRVIAQIDILYSNSMSEAANKSIKYLFLFPQKPKDFNDVLRILQRSVPKYNESFPTTFNGASRNDVLKSGIIPEKNIFAEDIQLAREQRYAINKLEKCSIC